MKRQLYALLILAMPLLLLLAACGGGGGGGGATVSGVAAAGAPLVGTVSLKDSSTPAQELSDTIGADGSFSFNVDGLKPPFILKAQGTAGGTSYTLYSFAAGPGTANINPFAHLAVANAAKNADLSTLYATPSATTMQTIAANLSKAVTDIQTKLQPLLALYNAPANPVSDSYKANHLGLDGILDTVKVDISSTGTITLTNKLTSAVIYSGAVSNFINGTLDPTKIPQPPAAYKISGRVTVNGAGLSNATVTLAGSGSSSTTTDLAGFYIFTDAVKGNYMLSAAKAGYDITPTSISLSVNSADVIDQNFTAVSTQSAGYFMSGTIRSGSNSGPGLSGATVTIAGMTATTTNTGSFIISGIPSGTYIFSASKNGYDTYTNPAYNIGSNQSGLNFYLTQPTIPYSISGIIHSGSNSGPGLSGATVSIAGMTATTNSTGNFSVTGIPPGTHTLTVSKSGYNTYLDPSYYVGSNQVGKNFYLTAVAVNPLDFWHIRSGNPVSNIPLRAVTYGNNTFVAVGFDTVATSSDGTTWTVGNVPADLRGVAYGNSTFLTVGSAGVISTSPDGNSWTPRTTPSVLAPSFLGVGYGNGIFVLGAVSGLFGNLYISTNGITGTGITSGTLASLMGIGYGNGILVAVGDMGTILTSPDGVTWTIRKSGTTAPLNSVAYGNSTFVAVGNGSGTILSSSDGASWISRNPGATNWLYSVAYGNGTFVAVGSGGLILSSPDGISWTRRSSGTTTTLTGVTFGNRTFVAVGLDGTILQSDPK